MQLAPWGYGQRYVFLVPFSFIGLLLFANRTFGQAPTPATTIRNFTTAFSQFAAREKVTIVTEDSPLDDQLSTEQTGKLMAELKSEDAITRYHAIANAYDYECIQDGNILILRKRYSNIHDLPYVSFQEASIALNHIERSLAFLNPPGPPLNHPDSAYYQFLGSLTPEQMILLKARRSMTTLTSEQRQLLQTVCAKDFMETYATLSRINTWYMKQLTKPDTVFRWVEVVPETPKILVLDGPLGLRGFRVQKGLSHGFVFGSGGPSSLINPRYNTPEKRPGFGTGLFIQQWDAAQTKMWKDALTGLRDRTSPPVEAMPASAPAVRLTLGQITKQLTDRARGQESYQIDPSLASKPVCLFGVENTSPSAIFQSIARVYALDITQPEENVLRLVPPRPPRVRGYNDVLKVLRRCFPDPYQRYYKAQFQTRMGFLNKPENMPEFAKRLLSREPGNPILANVLANESAPYVQNAIYDTTVQRLRAEVEPRIEKAEGRLLKFRDSGIEVQRFFTILCLVEIFSRLDQTAGPLTTRIGIMDADFGTWYGQFDSLTIQANVSPDRSGASISISDTRGERVLFEKTAGGPPRPSAPPR